MKKKNVKESKKKILTFFFKFMSYGNEIKKGIDMNL